MYYIFFSATAWSLWIIAADKSRWREIFPVCVFATSLAFASDLIMPYSLHWQYICKDIHPLFIHVADDLSIYPVATYLFIQWLPKKRTAGRMTGYWFIWTGVAISIEHIYVATGHMVHHNGWTFWHSYCADWLLFWLFYKMHRVLGLEKLSQ